jgi:hypothetical protein
MGSGSNQRYFDLRLQPFSNLDWQFDVCSPAIAICHGQHDRAMICGSGANVAHGRGVSGAGGTPLSLRLGSVYGQSGLFCILKSTLVMPQKRHLPLRVQA